jgi:hypothetical protein
VSASSVRRAATSAAYAHAAAVAEDTARGLAASSAEAVAVAAVAGRLRRLAVLTAQGHTAEGYAAPREADDA